MIKIYKYNKSLQIKKAYPLNRLITNETAGPKMEQERTQSDLPWRDPENGHYIRDTHQSLFTTPQRVVG